MNKMSRRLLIIGVSALMLVGPMAVSADGRVTYGDVSAAFQAFFNGFNLAAQGIPAAPADGFSRGRLSPLQEDGKNYCENDWILVSGAVFIPKGSGVDQLNHNDAVTLMSTSSSQFWLDGNVLSLLTTPVKVGRLGSDLVWYKHWGNFVEPYSLTVGTHYLSAEVILGGQPVPFSVSFNVLSATDLYCTQ